MYSVLFQYLFQSLAQSDLATAWDILRAFFNPVPADVRAILSAPNRYAWALFIVFLAGLSESFGQSIVLLANRVRPLRFFLSVFVNANFFIVSYIVWVLSVGTIAHVLFGQQIPWDRVAISVAISYLPLFLSYLGLLPYAGSPIIQLLYTWSYASLIQILSATFELHLWQAFVCAGGGYLVILVLRSTVGRPVMWCGNLILNRVAGTPLHRNLNEAYDALLDPGESEAPQ